MTYPILGQALLAQVASVSGGGPRPVETVGAAILSDGTFFVAAGFDPQGDPWHEFVRVWHLAKDMTVLGAIDVSVSDASLPTPSAVAIDGNRVFMVSRGDASAGTWYSWVIDCSSATPTIEHQNIYSPTYGADWSRVGQRHVYDQTNDRVIWAVRSYGDDLMLEVFRASTGESLCEISSGVHSAFLGFIGLHMNPADATQFIATTTSPPPTHASPGRLAFTVSLDGTGGSFDGMTLVYGPGENWDVAAGSPYVSGCGGILGEVWSSTESTMTCVDPLTGVVVASVAEGSNLDVGINTQGDSTTLSDGRYLLSYNEQYDSNFAYDSGLSFRGSLTCVDQLGSPPTMEIVPLEYFGQPPGEHVDSMGGGSVKIAQIDVDQSTGIILIAAGVQAGSGASEVFSVLAWAIQGPSGRIPINQQLQRRDGLGRGGVPLARGNATRQTSNQARVTY